MKIISVKFLFLLFMIVHLCLAFESYSSLNEIAKKYNPVINTTFCLSIQVDSNSMKYFDERTITTLLLESPTKETRKMFTELYQASVNRIQSLINKVNGLDAIEIKFKTTNFQVYNYNIKTEIQDKISKLDAKMKLVDKSHLNCRFFKFINYGIALNTIDILMYLPMLRLCYDKIYLQQMECPVSKFMDDHSTDLEYKSLYTTLYNDVSHNIKLINEIRLIMEDAALSFTPYNLVDLMLIRNYFEIINLNLEA